MRTRSARRGMRTAAVVCTLVLAATACSDDVAAPPSTGAGNPFFPEAAPATAAGEPAGGAPVALLADRSCDAVLEGFQSFAPAVLRDRFVVAPDELALEDATASGDAGAGLDAAAPTSARATAEVAGAGGTSDTNTQEAGIDEPDVVETDGEHVYLVDGEDLVVLDGATADVVSRTPLGTWGAQLLLQGDRLLAISGGMSNPDVPVPLPMPMPIEPGIGDGAEIGRAIEPAPFHAGTVVQLVDVADPAAPAILQTTELEGHHVTTRVVDGVARIVLSSWPEVQPFLDDVATRGATDDAIAAGLADTEVADWLPAFRTTEAGAGEDPVTDEGPMVDCEDVLLPAVNAGIAQTSILRVDFTDGFDPAHTTTVVADASTVYASSSTLYVAATRYLTVDDQARGAATTETTALHAFDLGSDGAATHAAAGEIPGFVLNQYALSEHDGHLRVAATENPPWGTDEVSESSVRVLRAEGDALVEVGAVTGLGRTEVIQSVRFLGPVGYVVTFRQTDPLYVIDLSDPTAPRALGELKIPGFSSYLHPVGEGRLVGIGRDASLEGVDAGLLVSLFDVSDPTDPRQLQTWTERDAWSAAGDDPKAFLWWAPEAAVAVPIERYGWNGADAGIVVLDVGDDGITERATVTADGRHPSRALVVQGRLWSLFDGGVVVSDLDDPAGGDLHALR